MFQLTVLSHACVKVEYGGISLLTDPWLLGSSYWRSWWNFPDPEISERDLDVDFVALSHLHWDHFHGPTLRKISERATVLIPFDRTRRMAQDLQRVGRKKVIELRHGETHVLGPDFSLQSYHFWPFLDSCQVIRAGERTILNANDCKIMGASLRELLHEHPVIDFALRSHSTANARACFVDAQGAPLLEEAGTERYAEAFWHFMASVRPRYAIPFASNHCHLHRDAMHFNANITTPIGVAATGKRLYPDLATELVIMTAGDSYSDKAGFALKDNQLLFAQREQLIEQMATKYSQKLDAYYKEEENARPRPEILERYFTSLLARINPLLRHAFRLGKIGVGYRDHREYGGVIVDFSARRCWQATAADLASANSPILWVPARIAGMSCRLDMWGHALISKRCLLQCDSKSISAMQRFALLLYLAEYRTLALREILTTRALRAWLPRWREFLVYLKVVWLVLRRVSGETIEQRLLSEARR